MRPLVYLSHSWRPEHHEANLAVWRVLAEVADLVVDASGETDPPYHVHRIEHLIAHCQVFVAVVSAPTGTSADGTVSPYEVFEMALAARADLRRAVVAEAGIDLDTGWLDLTGFEVVRIGSDLDGALDELRAWLGSVVADLRPPPAISAVERVVVIGADDADQRVTDATVRVADELHLRVDVLASDDDDAAAISTLRRADVAVVDVTAPDTWSVLGAAHALAIPTIRVVGGSARGGSDPTRERLPAILVGHEVGYQTDLVAGSTVDELADELRRRIEPLTKPITVHTGFEAGRVALDRS